MLLVRTQMASAQSVGTAVVGQRGRETHKVPDQLAHTVLRAFTAGLAILHLIQASAERLDVALQHRKNLACMTPDPTRQLPTLCRSSGITLLQVHVNGLFKGVNGAGRPCRWRTPVCRRDP